MSTNLTNFRGQMNGMKEEIRADYAAARSSRFRRNRAGVSSIGRGADYHLRNDADYYYMTEYVRDMHRNDGMIAQLTDRAVDLHIGPGFTVDFGTRDRALNRALSDAFYDVWMQAHLFDVGRSLTGPMAEKAFFRHMLMDGDHVILGTETGHVQSIEGHRVRSPNRVRDPELRLGVYKNAAGDLYRYLISLRSDDGWNAKLVKADVASVDTWLDVEQGIRQVFHVRSIRRTSDTRGITAYCPIFDYAGMFEDVQFALLVKQQLAAFLALSKETMPGATPDRTSIGQQDVVANGASGTGAGGEPAIQSVRAGSVVDPGPGKTYKVLQANIPSAETMAHVRSILQMLGLNLGLPLIAATLDASETNFSGWKGAMNIAEIGFLSKQNDFADQFHVPYTRLFLYRLLNGGDALSKLARAHVAKHGLADFYRHTWNKPRLKSIQPLEDEKASQLSLKIGTNSRRRILAGKGLDDGEVLRERMQDRYRELLSAYRYAEKLKSKGLSDVTWRDMLSAGDVPEPAVEPNPEENATAGRPKQ